MTGKELRARRLALKLTQVELGEYLGVSGNTIARWERGDMEIQHPKTLALALKALQAELHPSKVAKKK